MGRHKLEKTEVEVVAQKQKWADARNKKRRDTYARDTVYRSSVNSRNRTSYRSAHGVVLRDCRENLLRLEEFGETRKVAIDVEGELLVYERHCFTVKELAQVMGDYHPIVLYRWHRDNKFPRPTIQVVDDNLVIHPKSLVYLDTQVRGLMTVFGDHQADKQYFHTTDTETIQQLFGAMDSVW